MVMEAPKRAVAMIVEKCIVDGGSGAVRIFEGLWVIVIVRWRREQWKRCCLRVNNVWDRGTLIDICSRVLGFNLSTQRR